ncbi:MAG: thymidylate synthase [Candidatus Woesearchaeota archaeon]
MKGYLDIVRKILEQGQRKDDRTGTGTLAIAGVMFEHNMPEGFPLLTTKKMPFRLIASEMEFFIKGITNKKWLQERNNHIWDEWCSPEKVKYGHDEETKKKMMEEIELGPIYGWQWRNFGAKYVSYDKPPQSNGIDQLRCVVETLKKNPSDRRMIVSAWNPTDLPRMALPPCHFCFQVVVIEDKLSLMWSQRSVDVALGLPFNIAGYGLLLHLLAKESGLKEGRLVGFLGDTHIYLNHIQGLREQLGREPFPLPKIKTERFKSIFEWEYTDSEILDYRCHPKIHFEISV